MFILNAKIAQKYILFLFVQLKYTKTRFFNIEMVLLFSTALVSLHSEINLIFAFHFSKTKDCKQLFDIYYGI